MKSYPSFEPPEYRDWQPVREELERFSATLSASPARRTRIEAAPLAMKLALYRGLLRTRLLDIALKRWVLQGVISKAWLGFGEEAVTIGAVHALSEHDVIGPMIRNEGVCIERGMPVASVFRSYLSAAESPPRGRDMHHGDLARGVVAPISHVGALVPVMAGMALAFKMRKEPRVALTFVGDGSVRTGEFHEGLGLAAALRAPLVVVLQDNAVALGTRRETHSRAALEELARAYGVPGLACDGNNVLDVWAAASDAVELARSGGGPVVLVARTFRMGGHATHDEVEARRLFSSEEFAAWGRRDPVRLYEAWLTEGTSLDKPKADRSVLATVEGDVEAEIEAAANEARRATPPQASTLLDGVVSG